MSLSIYWQNRLIQTAKSVGIDPIEAMYCLQNNHRKAHMMSSEDMLCEHLVRYMAHYRALPPDLRVMMEREQIRLRIERRQMEWQRLELERLEWEQQQRQRQEQMELEEERRRRHFEGQYGVVCLDNLYTGEHFGGMRRVRRVEQPNPVIVEKNSLQQSACSGCSDYRGSNEGGNFFCCAMHPYGPGANTCPDKQ